MTTNLVWHFLNFPVLLCSANPPTKLHRKPLRQWNLYYLADITLPKGWIRILETVWNRLLGKALTHFSGTGAWSTLEKGNFWNNHLPKPFPFCWCPQELRFCSDSWLWLPLPGGTPSLHACRVSSESLLRGSLSNNSPIAPLIDGWRQHKI